MGKISFSHVRVTKSKFKNRKAFYLVWVTYSKNKKAKSWFRVIATREFLLYITIFQNFLKRI